MPGNTAGMLRYVATLIAATAATAASGADLYVSGSQARELCQTNQDWCLGFVTGALDGWAALESYYPGEKFCAPPGRTAGELKDLFVDELNARPELREEPAAYLLYERLIASFPCS